ncbi:MAG TPA: hypothetical protein VL358_04960 [Caulobacteraceae bacterium]|nr:hypothetical protein [Caulobacteraceae bacterium]
MSFALWKSFNWEFAMAQEIEHHPHPKRRRLQSIEGAADMMTLGVIVALGIAMVIGLVTASGH